MTIKDYLFTAMILFSVMGGVYNAIKFFVLNKHVSNDLKHDLSDFKEVVFKRIDEEKRRTDSQGERIAGIEGQFKTMNMMIEKIFNALINGKRRR